MVHGGAWTANDRTTPWYVCEQLAKRGLTVLSLDFRCGPKFTHPAASADVVAGIKFLRAHTSHFEIDSESIGIIGSSSGGHLALFCGLNSQRDDLQTTESRDLDGTFKSLPEVSARPAYIVALWPVSNPTYRYQYALNHQRKDLVRAHDGYFRSERAMDDASVQRTLRTKESEDPPPTFVVQPGLDANVPLAMTLDLIDALQERQGEVVYRFLPGLPHAFAYQPSADSELCCHYVWQFISDQLTKF